MEETKTPLFYTEFSQGAIEVYDDYLVIYRNWLPFTKFKYGRIRKIIFINDIQHMTYKGCGFLPGIFGFTFKHFNRPVRFMFNKWFFWRSIPFNSQMTPIFEYLNKKIIENNK